MHISNYHNSVIKKIFNILGAATGLIVFLPIVIIITVCSKLSDPGPILFKQKRIGLGGKEFTLIKFRTMVVGAEKLQNKYKHLNISDGPTFKIPNDPRYTSFGKFLVKTGLDELPQIVNILRGEMAFVGPRPFPLYEEKYLTKKQKMREMVLPGITSSWVIKGGHRMNFIKWMELDAQYVKNGTLVTDLNILTSTVLLITKLTIRKLASFIN